MEVSEVIRPGMANEQTFDVGEEHLALTVGSGASRVLATPWMIAFMERVCHALLVRSLPETYSSVGVQVNIRHLAPTPLGGKVRVRGEVSAVDGWRVSFNVSAWDEQEQVGAGEHLRMVIDRERFLRRVSAKMEQKG